MVRMSNKNKIKTTKKIENKKTTPPKIVAKEAGKKGLTKQGRISVKNIR